MSVAFYGDYDLTETVRIPFNTFDSEDPSKSVTVTDLVAGDIKVYGEGVIGTPTGITVDLNVSVTGNHFAIIDLTDTNDVGFYAVGSRYTVRMEGVTIDGGTVNAWIGSFSIGISVRLNATAVANLEDQYDTTGLSGDTFPATQAQIGTLSSGSAAVNTTTTGVHSGSVPTTVGTPTNAATDTTQLNGTYHSWVPDGTIEFAYEFNIGANASPVDVTWDGYVQGINDNVEVYARNWVGNSWDQVGTINGTVSATDQQNLFSLTTAHVNTGANAGDVRIRFESSGGDIATTLATDRILVGFTITNQSIGYAQGAIWFDDSVSNTNTTAFVDGVADNPVSSWAAVKSLLTSVGIKRVHVANGSSVTLDSTITNLTMMGSNWTLALGTQAISGLHVEGASITGVGTAGAKMPDFHDCIFGVATLPPAEFKRCGFGTGELGGGQGLFTAGSNGDYVFESCFSVVAGSGTPQFNFAGKGATTTINNRGWFGGYQATIDSDNVISHECVKGGGQTFLMSGGTLELRADCREVTLTLSAGAASTTQCILYTGDVTISGTATATSTIQLDGIGLDPADTSVNTTVTNRMINRERWIGGDYALSTNASGNVLAKSDGDNELMEKRTMPRV